MAVTQIGVQNELTTYFPGIANDPLYASSWKVGLFLGQGMTDRSFRRALKALEAELASDLEKRLRPWGFLSSRPDMTVARQDAQSYWQGRAAGTQDKDQRYAHLLTDLLTRHEAAGGFSFSQGFLGSKRAQLYVSVVPAPTFREQLRAGKHWKDPGVPGSHGEFTHRLQWHLVMRSGLLGGTGAAAPVFRAAGSLTWVVSPGGLRNNAPETDLWQALCDRDRVNGNNQIGFEADSANDFRCPEHFNEFLTAGGGVASNKYPLLHAFLAARTQKRAAFDPADYIARKLFHTAFAGCTNTQKEEVYRAIGGKDLLANHRHGQPYASLGLLQQQAIDAHMAARKSGILA